MKHLILSILLCALGSLLVSGQATQNYLFGIEDKIKIGFTQSITNNDITDLQAVIDTLSTIENRGNTHWKEYWTAYALYQKSIFSVYGRSPNQEQGKADVEDAINTLKDVDNKNVEDYALLGLMKGYSLQWKAMFAMAKQSSIASNWAKNAIDVDEHNPRAQYVFGNNDFHTPGMFGGGKKADEYLTRALSIFKESIPNPMMPSWGMDEAFYMLVKTKIKADDDKGAATVLAEALKIFPENNRLLSLKYNASE